MFALFGRIVTVYNRAHSGTCVDVCMYGLPQHSVKAAGGGLSCGTGQRFRLLRYIALWCTARAVVHAHAQLVMARGALWSLAHTASQRRSCAAQLQEHGHLSQRPSRYKRSRPRHSTFSKRVPSSCSRPVVREDLRAAM